MYVMLTLFPSVQADSPTTQTELDELDYAPLAQHIANCIRQAPATDGLVFSINGPWGAGKTTMLEFIKTYLQSGPKESAPKIVEFNPWWYSTSDGLIIQFLRLLESEIAGLKLKQSVSDAMMLFIRTATKKLAAGLVNISPAPEALRDVINESLESGYREPKTRSLSELRNEIAAQLSKSDQVIVIIDDIDRLTPQELRQLFQLVRAVCNLPNIIYLLAFDREMVATALERELGSTGSQFLEKVIQVPFDLPSPRGPRVRKMFQNRVDSLSRSTPRQLFDSELWLGLFLQGIEPLLSTPRAVIRLFNAVAITYPPVCGEVDFVDFLGVEVLRVFAPKTYGTIRDNKDRFLGNQLDGVAAQDSHKSFHRLWVDEIHDQRAQAAVKQIVLRLFPSVQSAFMGPMSFSPIPATTSLQVRVSTTRGFDKCFSYSMSATDMPRIAYNHIAHEEYDVGALVSTLEELSHPSEGPNRAHCLLEYLRDDATHGRLPEKRIKPLFTALMHAVDAILPGNEKAFMWTIDALLWRMTPTDITENIQECLWAGDCGIVVAAHLAREVELASPERDATPFFSAFLLKEEPLKLVRNFLTERLLKIPPASVLVLPEFIQVLFAVHHISPSIASKFISSVDSDPVLFIKFAKHFVSQTGQSQGFRRRFGAVLARSSLNFLGIDVDQFVAHIRTVSQMDEAEISTIVDDVRFLQGLVDPLDSDVDL